MPKEKWFGHLVMVWLTVAVMPGMALASEKSDQMTGNGSIQFEKADWLTPPVDPERPTEGVDPNGESPKTEGELRLDFVSKLNFGAQAISNKDRTYFATAQQFKDDTPARGSYVQVTDNRGTLGGWQLSVRQDHQFKNETGEHKELAGAVLSLDKQWANSQLSQEYSPTIVKDAITINHIGTTYPIAVAEKGKGSGTWLIEFGSSGDVEGIEKTLVPVLNADGQPVTDAKSGNKPIFRNEAISLFVPGKTTKEPLKYTTVLTWIIAELS